MDRIISDRVKNRPEFLELVLKRGRFARRLTYCMLIMYFAFILSVAFVPELLGRAIGASVITLGMPVGIGIILIVFALTGFYVYRANTEFDGLNHSVRKHIEEMK